jgi:hypothetical protein
MIVTHRITSPPTATEWRRFVKVHPAADVLPLMATDQLQELAEDIRQNGLKTQVVMFGDLTLSPKSAAVLVDGRNRLDACARLGWPIIDPDTGDWHPDFQRHVTGGGLDHDTIVRDVVSWNIRRRHLTERERVDLALKVIEQGRLFLKTDRNGNEQGASNTPPPKTGKPFPVSKGGRGKTSVVSDVAKMANVSKPTARKHLAARGAVPMPTTKPKIPPTAGAAPPSPAAPSAGKRERAEVSTPQRSPRQRAGIALQAFSDNRQLQAGLRKILDSAAKMVRSYPKHAGDFSAFFAALADLAAAAVADPKAGAR